MAIPPPPDESSIFGSAPPPPPPENAVFGGQQVPPPPPEEQVFHPSFAEKLGNDLWGGYREASLNGFGGLVARHIYTDVMGVPKDKVNAALQSARQDAAAQMARGGAINVPTPLGNFNPSQLGAEMLGGADPTLAVPIPGVGAAGGLVARTVKSALGHAALGAASDAAYQGADIIDGVQKDFDANRMVQSAAGMGMLGAAAPFVHSLFKARGVDTLPPETPEGVTRPLTGQGLSPEDMSAYHDVLTTGNESDIHNFFNGRNVQVPTHTDIHEWVKRRDGGEGAPGVTDDQVFQGVTEPPQQPDLRQAVSDHIDQVTQNWKNKPDYETINHTDDIQHPDVQSSAKAEGADDPTVKGFYSPIDGKVRIFANRLGDDPVNTLHAILYHESLGHYGLAQQFGDKLDSTINTLLTRNVGQFGRDVKAYMEANPGAYGGDRTRAAEEVLANMSNNGTLKPSLADAVTSHIRRFGRAMGLDLSYSDGEVRQILNMAHQAVIKGVDRDVARNGFRTGENYRPTDLGGQPTSPNRFMFTGRKATGFDAYDPTAFTANDGKRRNEISDDEAALKNLPPLNTETRLEDVLHHPELYKQYPQLRDLSVYRLNRKEGDTLSGFYAPRTKSIGLMNGIHDPLNTLLHEVQHAVQHIENHSNGTSVATSGWQEYQHSLGEVEARATESRRNLSYDQRASINGIINPYVYGGVDPEKIIASPPFKTRFDGIAASDNRFMRDSDLKPKDVAEEAYSRFQAGYVPKSRSVEESMKMAKDTAISPAAIKDLRSAGNLDRKLFVYDQAAREVNDKLLGFAEKEKLGTLNDIDRREALEAVTQFHYILGRIENDANQIGRALQAMKAIQFSRNNLQKLQELAIHEDFFNGLGDPEVMNRFLKQVAALGANNPQGVAVLAKTVMKPYWEQYVNTFHFNAMLSALSTHVKAPVDMATGIARNVLEKIVAMPIGHVRRLLGGTGEAISPEELAMHTYGIIRAVTDRETYRAVADATKSGQGLVVRPDGSRVATNVQNSYGAISNPHIPGVSIPTQLISGQDTFFRTIESSGQIYSMAVRQAQADLKGKPHNWDDVMTLASAYSHSPTTEMVRIAMDETNRTLLLNGNGFNKWIDRYKAYKPGMSNGERVAAFVANTLAPFIRVESNSLINRVIQRSPLAFLDKYTQQQLRMGGPQADIAMAKILYGSVSLGMAWVAADETKKKITGYLSEDNRKRLELEAGGERPDAVYENGGYTQGSNLAMSLFPWDQHNATAQSVKNIREAFDAGANKGQVGSALLAALGSTMQNMAKSSWINDISPAIEAMTAQGATAGQKAGKFLGAEAGTFVPSLANQVEKLTDVQRDTRPGGNGSVMDQVVGQTVNTVVARIPGLAQSLPAKESVYGDTMPTGQTPEGVHTWVGRGNNVPETTEPAERELNRLANLTKAAIVTPVQGTIHIAPGVSVKLTPAQQNEYQMYSGQTVVQAVREQQQSGEWDKLTDAQRVLFVRKTETEAKKQVKGLLVQKPGWFNESQLNDLRSKLSGQ